MTDQQFELMITCLLGAVAIAFSALAAVLTVAIGGWWIAVGTWFVVGYLAGGLLAGLVMHVPEGARTMAIVLPSTFDGLPLWILAAFGYATVCIWWIAIIVTESITHERAEYFARYNRKQIAIRLKLARGQMLNG